MPFHIHTYGGGRDAEERRRVAVFAWPVVMSATVFTAQAWSVVLGEFKGGATWRKFRANGGPRAVGVQRRGGVRRG